MSGRDISQEQLSLSFESCESRDLCFLACYFYIDRMVKLIYFYGMKIKDDLIYAIATQLLRIAKKQGRIENIPLQLDSGISVSPTEAHTIMEIGINNSINVTEIGIRFGVTKSAASQIVARLNKKGLVEKKVSAHSAKELEIRLTEQGEEVFTEMKKLRRIHYDNIAERLKAFSLDQITTATAFLDAVEGVMNERITRR